MPQPAPLFIVASPRPRVGKTLLARLVTEFFRADGRAVTGFDLNPREPTFATYFSYLAATVDIADTRGQMALFDRVIGNTTAATVIDLGYGAFETFFSVMTEIGFAQEAQRRNIEPIVRGVVDRPSFSFAAYLTEAPGGPTEIHSWIAGIFAEFRELELRLMMGKLGASLGITASRLGEVLRAGR